MLFLRASCLTSRLCLRIPLDGRLDLVLTVVVLTGVAPFGVACVFGFVFFPESANFLSGFLAGVPVFDLKQADEFIELRLCLVHFEQIIFSHQTPPRSGLASDQVPFFLEYRFVYHGVLLDKHARRFCGRRLLDCRLMRSFRDFVYKG